MRDLRDRILAGDAVVAGVLSGTSADGIDVALVRFPSRDPARDGADLPPPELLAFETTAFPGDLGERVRSVLDEESPLDLRGVALLSRDLGRAFGAAARALADRSGRALDLVGSHGQTLWHHDGVEPSGPATLQLGDGCHAAEAGCAPVVSDFRQRDLAAGGEGAPLTALVDGLLFRDAPRPLAVLNLGGVGNLTFLEDRRPPRALDTGPANALLDGLARRLSGRRMDEGGRIAAAGRVIPALLDELLAHPFLDRGPPRSTGRNTFGRAWLDGVVARAGGAGAPDVLSTAVRFVAESVALALERFGPEGTLLLVAAGGGVRNEALLAALRDRLAVPVEPSGARGVDPDAREAVAFAVLAARAACGVPSTSPSATGARAGRVLGKLSPAP